MIIKNSSSQVMESAGEITSKKATINQGKIRKLQYILTEGLYKDPIGAVINEITANAIDSVRESGKDPVENPVVVTLNSTDNKFSLSIEDKGVGMSKEFFQDFFMDMLSSTKEEDDNSIGNFGIGGKSWSSLKRAVTFTVVKDKKKCKFLCFKGDEFIESELLLEENTTEENGVLFELPINDYNEYYTFCNKAKQKLAYYDTVALIINGILHENKINRTEHFQWSEDGLNELHLCLKDVVYAIDYQRLGIQRINIPIALRFDLNSGITPTPSREDILYNKETIKLITDKLGKVADYLVNKHNETVSKCSNLAEAYDHIDAYYKTLELGESNFTLNTILQYSSITVKDADLTGAVLNTPRFYKRLYLEMLHEYDPIALDTYNNSWKKKNLHYEFHRTPANSYKTIKVKPGLSGNIKEFLRNKYGSNTLYVERNFKNRGLDGYRALLLLLDNEKQKWRDQIKEYQLIQSNLWNTWIDETDIENNQDFIKWVTQKKATQKANRKKGITQGKHKILNKQKDEVTLHIARKHSYGTIAVFDKKTKKIAELNKLGKLSILLEKEWLEKKEDLYKWLTFEEVQFIYSGERDTKHINNKHIVSMEEFKKSKPFARLATYCLAEQMLNVMPQNEELIYEAFPKYGELKKQIEDYIPDGHYVDSELIPIILEEAALNNNWDMNIYPDILEFQKIIRKFGFIDLIKDEWKQTEEQKAIAKNMMYVLLKHQKIHHNILEEMELVDKIPIEIYAEEEAKLEIIK